jgi:hypothetical protein
MSEPIEIRRDEDGSLDEIVAHDVAIHLEQMSDTHWWMSIEKAGRLYHLNLTARRAKITATVEAAD